MKLIQTPSGGPPALGTLPKRYTTFSRLYIGYTRREGDLHAFFEHENQATTPSMAENGDLLSGKKFDLITWLENLVSPSVPASDKCYGHRWANIIAHGHFSNRKDILIVYHRVHKVFLYLT